MRLVELVDLPAEAKYHLLQALGAIMSEISEDNFCSGWLVGTEDMLPRRVAQMLRGDGPDDNELIRWLVTEEQAGIMALLAELADGWPFFIDEDVYEHYMTYDEWRENY